ncbi:MAG: hypothetical protein ACI8RZ_006627 [Myxococcota bacterium]|jgi:hypothetical protein
MAELNHPVREGPSESRATRLRAPLAEKTGGRAGQVGTIKSRDRRSLEVLRYCKPRLRPWALIATGPLRGPRCTRFRPAFSVFGLSLKPRLPCCLRPRQRIWRAGPATRPTAVSPCARPGELRLLNWRSKTIQSTKLGGRQPPDRLRRTHPVPVPLHESTISPSTTGTCRTSGSVQSVQRGSHLTGSGSLRPSPCRVTNRQSARLRPALVELQAGTSGTPTMQPPDHLRRTPRLRRCPSTPSSPTRLRAVARRSP